MTEDTRYYLKLYGIDTDDWTTSFAGTTFNNHLVKEYISDAASVATNTAWSSNGVAFIYPHNIKKKYYVEGVVEGQITFSSVGVTSYVSDFVVQIVKFSDVDNSETVLATTGTRDVNDTYVYTPPGVGDEIVYQFWIDVFESGKEITENERLGIRVKWDVDNYSTATASLLHDNDATYEDVKVTIPLLGV